MCEGHDNNSNNKNGWKACLGVPKRIVGLLCREPFPHHGRGLVGARAGQRSGRGFLERRRHAHAEGVRERRVSHGIGGQATT